MLSFIVYPTTLVFVGALLNQCDEVKVGFITICVGLAGIVATLVASV